MKVTFFVLLMAVLTTFNIYSQTGVFREVTGEVEIRRPGETAFSAVSTGQEISQDTIVSTGFRSTAIVAIGSTVITVRPLTRLSLAEISSTAAEENVNVNLQAGRVRVQVNPPAGTRANSTVQSPSATASVRGTEYDMDTRNINVQRGKVMFKGIKGPPHSVLGGESSTITKTGGAQDPIGLSESDLTPASPAANTSSPAGGIANTGSASEPSAPAPAADGNFDLTLTW